MMEGTAKVYANPYAAEVHCVCMVIDWMAMGLEFGDTAEAYYEREKEKIRLPDWAVTFIGEIFERLRPEPQGEKNGDESLLAGPETEENVYPCSKCGAPRTKAEGGTTFTVCDDCWDAPEGRGGGG